MVVSSLSPPFISPPPRKTLNPNKILTISSSASLLPSPKPRSRRKNHLRPKLPLPPKPQPGLTIPLEIETPIVEEEASVVVEEEEEEEEESVQELTFESSQSPDPLPYPNPSPKSAVLDLSLRFAALLAVQTAAAIWLFGRGGGGDGRVKPEEITNFDARVVENEVGKIGKAKIESDFDRLVWEIRQMAREARETEAKEREEKELENERVLMGLERDSGGGKSGSRKRLGFVRTNVVRRKSAGKGFNRVKKVEEEDIADENGGIRQIGRQNPLRMSLNLHESRQSASLSKMTKKTADVGEFDTSLRTTEISEIDHATSLVNGKSTEREIQVKQSFGEGEIPSSTKYRNINGGSESPAQKKEAVEKSVVKKYKGGMLDHRKKPWWLKLPFVLAVLLRRVSDRSCPKGLYSLKMNSPSGEEDSESYTIVFQDQGDAANFCYLLESFFEELDDFRADVVPLTINELEDGVMSGALKVIVVKKGQLQLYAGQPLSEIEAALRSLLD